MTKVPNGVERAASFFHLQSWFRLIGLCVLVGVVSGLGALLFDLALKFVEHGILTEWLFKTGTPGYPYWALAVVPMVGGGLAGFLALWLAPDARGHGTDAVIRAFHREKGEIRARVPLIKGICSILTIGSGGSAGKEGPIAQIGAGFGSTLASVLSLSVRDRRLLMLAGLAGGIGAIFKAPLGGALFAAEVLYREPDFEHDAVIPGVISSVTAYSVFTGIEGYLTGAEGHARILNFSSNAIIGFPSRGGNSLELLHYALLSLICVFVAFLFVKFLRWTEHDVFRQLPIHKGLKPALGGAILGVLVLAMIFSIGQMNSAEGYAIGGSHPSHLMGGGNAYMQSLLEEALSPQRLGPWVSFKLAGFMAVVVLAKIVATSLTCGSGGSGGLLFPSLFLGGATGAAYARFCRALDETGYLPSYLALTPGASAGMILVGMGALFAACTKTPIASLVMVSEITGSYGLLVPLMLACASAYVLSRSIVMNHEQVAGIADSPAHRGEFQVNVLEEIKVSDALLIDSIKPEMFTADTPFDRVLERIKGSSATVFPIVDENQCLIGIFSLSDIRQIMNEQSVGHLVVAGDLGTTDVATVTPDMNLDDALRLFTRKNLDELPVVERNLPAHAPSRNTISAAIKAPRGPVGSLRVIGMLSRRTLIGAYHRKLMAQEAANAQDNRGSQVFVDALTANDEKCEAAFERLDKVPALPESAPQNDGDPALLNDPPDSAGLHPQNFGTEK